MNKNPINLYEHYKNTPKKLKIVCDWDEVIQACEPYALYSAQKKFWGTGDKNWFENFWKNINDGKGVDYSPYNSQLKGFGKEWAEKQKEVKNSPNFYQEAPFLTIAEDLLELIRENKVEQLIFLSAYDKRKFPEGDERKRKIFRETFLKLAEFTETNREGIYRKNIRLQLLAFDSEMQGSNKVDWIKENTSDFDIFIDDNPYICNGVLEKMSEYFKFCSKCQKVQKSNCKDCVQIKMKVIAPYYPATAEKQFYKDVLLVEQKISNLKKENFNLNDK